MVESGLRTTVRGGGRQHGGLKANKTKSERNQLHEGKNWPKMSEEQTYFNVASFS